MDNIWKDGVFFYVHLEFLNLNFWMQIISCTGGSYGFRLNPALYLIHHGQVSFQKTSGQATFGSL